jgi:hypothetical protein
MKRELKKKKRLQNKQDKKQAYVDALDLNQLWEDFANSFNKNGTPEFKTAWSFVCKKTKIDWQRKVLYWLIGPAVVVEKGQRPEFNLPQYDWEEKRKKGFWYSSGNIEALKQDINSKASAYEAVRQAGKVNVTTIVRLNNLLEQLEDEFGGRLMLPGLSMKENALRAQLYMNLVTQVINLSSNAQLMYARTQGLDLERLDAFFAMFGNQMGRTAAMLMGSSTADQGAENPLRSQFEKVVNLVTNKATEFNLPLPNDLAAAIKETTVEAKIQKKKPN